MSKISRNLFHTIFGTGQPATPVSRGYTSGHDLAVLVALGRATGPKVVVEIGIQRGQTAKTLLESCPSITRYIGIDVLPGHSTTLKQQRLEVPAKAGELAEHDSRLTLLVLEGGSRAVTQEMIPDGSVDLVFIDGDHSEAGVLFDTALARRIVRPGGIIAWHDYKQETGCGVMTTIDAMNKENGDSICLVEGTWTCFQFAGEWKAIAH